MLWLLNVGKLPFIFLSQSCKRPKVFRRQISPVFLYLYWRYKLRKLAVEICLKIRTTAANVMVYRYGKYFIFQHCTMYGRYLIGKFPDNDS
jgi:hypothetical protein